MKTSEYAAVAAVHSLDAERWHAAFSAVIDRIAPRFARYEPPRHAGELLAGNATTVEEAARVVLRFVERIDMASDK
ncbi:hypothetical protein [Mycobacterium sp.]|uniref:hypothetical protein n=1 Tax=Mycobacterium sp. TaxID=1785 RepID=UPI003BACC9E8